MDSPPDWRERAGCGEADPTLFDAIDQAVADKCILLYCLHCPVRGDCDEEAQRIISADAAQDIRQLSGTWGGVTYSNSRRLRGGHVCSRCGAAYVLGSGQRQRSCPRECAA